jgi:tetratricopeptide (TPR) repeat protein
MATFFEIKKRTLIPNWRSFEVTALSGELDGILSSDQKKYDIDFFENQLALFNDRPNIGIAADLINFAYTHKIINNDQIIKVCNYLLDREDLLSKPLIEISKSLKVGKVENIQTEFLAVPSFDFFHEDNILISYLHKKINELKKKIIENPSNAIVRVEIARLYSILGQLDKAHEHIKVALSFGKENRFVLRSVVRFFSHINEIDISHDILRKSDIIKHDPWLLSAELSVSMLRGRTSKFIDTAFLMSKSQQFSQLSLTELRAGLATIEMYSGSHKKANDLFSKSLISPNDNSLAQIEWASSQDKQLHLPNIDLNSVINPFEARALDAFNGENWVKCLEFSTKWFLDMPFARRPIVMAQHIASTFLNDLNKSIAYCKAGLISNPFDLLLLNNISYNLCLLGRLDEAEQYLRTTDSINSDSYVHDVCISATKGLLFFKQKDFEAGRFFYKKALEMAQEKKDQPLFKAAFANYLREELLIDNKETETLFPVFEKLFKEKETDPSLSKLKEEILRLRNEKK